MQTQDCSLLDGISPDDYLLILERAQRRAIAAGSRLIGEGTIPDALFVLRSGYADVLATTASGDERRLKRVGPGETVGEMAMLTGQAASATVRAVTDLEVLAISAADFHQLASAIPALYRNLSVLLSHRLAGANRLAVRERGGRATTLIVAPDTPPLLGFAFACSLAWHAHGPVLLLHVSGTEPHEALVALVEGLPPTAAPLARAHILLREPVGIYAPAALAETVDELCASFSHVLVQIDTAYPLPPFAAKVVQLCGDAPIPVTAVGTLTISGWAAPTGRWPEGATPIVRVPTPQASDQADLRDGLLPAVSACGQALGRAARCVAGLTIGVALGAGGARGYAHLGVLRVLRRAGVPIDYLAGTSIGAVVAGLHALGYSGAESAQAMDTVGALAFRPTLPLAALLSSRRLRDGLRQIGGDTRIEDLPMPLGLVATDITTGQEVVFRRGLLWLAALASLSIPGVLPPQRVGPYTLVDGGVVNPVPVSVLAAMGADVTIAVKLASYPRRATLDGEALDHGKGAPPVLHTLLRSLDLLHARVATTCVATVQIEPITRDLHPVGLRNFSRGRRYCMLGEAAAEAALPAISAALPWLDSQSG